MLTGTAHTAGYHIAGKFPCSDAEVVGYDGRQNLIGDRLWGRHVPIVEKWRDMAVNIPKIHSYVYVRFQKGFTTRQDKKRA